MRIAIISDTHDHKKRTVQAVEVLRSEGAETLIHCGDLTGPDIVHACGGLPSYYVFGNNDFQQDVLRAAMNEVGGTCLDFGGEILLDGKRIAVTHGDSLREMRRLAAAEPDYLLFGHVHVTADRREGPTRWINPGALHRARRWTVALLDTDHDELHFFDIR